MNEIREIVTRAIIAKGKKSFNIIQNVYTDVSPYSILGCWIINHEFEASKTEFDVSISGSFEVNIWYSTSNNLKTDVLREKVKYTKNIKTKQIVKTFLENSDDVIAKVIEPPKVTNAKILDNAIELDISIEMLAEIIGETKMQVTVFNQEVNNEEIEDLDIEIDEDFLDER